jgi:triacylglycerol lipase
MSDFNQIDPVRAIPVDIADKVAALGNGLSDELVAGSRAIYLPVLAAKTWKGVAVTNDVAYGPDPRHLLDVHIPGGAAGAPAVIYFHGGGLVRGHKNEEGDLVYGNVANMFASHGIVGLNATYRLAPEHRWPAGSRDVGDALAWTRAHIGEYGGDPDKIFLMGHSAGATHVAGYALRGNMWENEQAGCAGIILISGVYEASLDDQRQNQLDYYGSEPARYAEMSTIGNANPGDLAVFLSVAENEPLRFQRKGLRLLAEIAVKSERVPRFKQVLGHNHISEIDSIGTGDASLEPHLLAFVRESV